jgi:ATP phosphoribosyltransferase regulatory subunit
VGHVALARGALAAVDDPALRAELEELLSRKDAEGIARAARGRAKVPRRAARLLEALPGLYGEPDATLGRARALPIDRAMRRALDELEQALARARGLGAPASLTVDLGEVRGFGYYTGIRFAGYVSGVGDAILTGGRYDDLVGRYGREAQATGFAVDVEAIAQAEHARGADETPAPRGVALRCLGDAACAGRADRVAGALRRAGIRAVVDLDRRAGAAPAAAAAVTLLCEGRRARAIDARGSRAVAERAVRAAAAGDCGPLLVALGTNLKGAS